ncbi:MAG: YjbQ family protein [Gammaproteobacteria bacterium]|jgi:secondary thiamine-phosphate synthase enzyme|nr:YjbQ family protein [Gammaproteobacteria bacterium]MBT7229597.1 YjbQ family protein [Gammaproteobacteria bacterium]
MVETFEILTSHAGLHDITPTIRQRVERSRVESGLCTLFIRHTSASLLLQENADPSCQRDLEVWLNRLVPEGDALYTHTNEGEDDMPSHIKSMLTQSSLAIPVLAGQLLLGTWQGIFLWEHRQNSHERKLAMHLNS